jgi:hypothetical protein
VLWLVKAQLNPLHEELNIAAGAPFGGSLGGSFG